jgi:hypothetical protein
MNIDIDIDQILIKYGHRSNIKWIQRYKYKYSSYIEVKLSHTEIKLSHISYKKVA